MSVPPEATADGYSPDSYITIAKAKETVRVLKQFIKRSVKVSEPEKKKAKRLPLGEEEHVSDSGYDGTVVLDINMKKIPLNKTTFIHSIGPLPSPWKFECPDIDVCLIVKDLDPLKSLPDRELDLETTKQFYRTRLEEAGFDKDFLSHRLMILPMRELLTEFGSYAAKRKLAASYGVFLADRRLMANKFSCLKSFLGKQFWSEYKRVPFPVDLAKEGPALKVELMRALDCTALYIQGRGSQESVQIGLLSQPDAELAYNLTFVLKEVHQILGPNVSYLRLGVATAGDTSSANPCPFPIPFFFDMNSANDVSDQQICRRTRALNGINPFEVASK